MSGRSCTRCEARSFWRCMRASSQWQPGFRTGTGPERWPRAYLRKEVSEPGTEKILPRQFLPARRGRCRTLERGLRRGCALISEKRSRSQERRRICRANSSRHAVDDAACWNGGLRRGCALIFEKKSRSPERRSICRANVRTPEQLALHADIVEPQDIVGSIIASSCISYAFGWRCNDPLCGRPPIGVRWSSLSSMRKAVTCQEAEQLVLHELGNHVGARAARPL